MQDRHFGPKSGEENKEKIDPIIVNWVEKIPVIGWIIKTIKTKNPIVVLPIIALLSIPPLKVGSIIFDTPFWDFALDPLMVCGVYLVVTVIYLIRWYTDKISWKPVLIYAVLVIIVASGALFNKYVLKESAVLFPDPKNNTSLISEEAKVVVDHTKENSRSESDGVKVVTVKLVPGEISEHSFKDFAGFKSWQACYHDVYYVEFQQESSPWQSLKVPWGTIDILKIIRLLSNSECEVDFKFFY